MISATTEQLLSIACKAIEHQCAKNETRRKKNAYHEAWRTYECEGVYRDWIPMEDRIRQGHPNWFDALDATKNEHDAYLAAKRAEYNAKRRLETAIRGVK